MKVLWLMRHAGFARHYDPVIRLLAAAGHRVHIAYDSDRNKFGENVVAERLAEECAGVTTDRMPRREETLWSVAATAVRTLQDYARYHEPEYAHAPLLQERARKFLPASYVKTVAFFAGMPRGLAVLKRALAFAEAAAPVPAEAEALLDRERPDLLIVTPLVDFGSRQVDYVKAARRRGIPTALAVASWDNLTNKGLIRWVPDRVFVWNRAQAEEAVTLHGVPGDRVVVTGAQTFDHWFDWRPSRSREEFCREVGLDPAKPFILYLGSSPFLAPQEADYVERWLDTLRRSGRPLVADAGVLVRPHPNNTRQWVGRDLSRHGNAAVWPPPGTDPFAAQFKFDFFDSLYYCGAVVGVNTSAQIEAAIVGRAVCTVRAADFSHSQEGTLHFRHLAGAEGGLLYVADDLAAHVAQLQDVLAGRADVAARTARFVEAFVRPHGRDVAAAPLVAGAIETLAATPPPPAPEPGWAGAARAALWLPAQAVRVSWEARGQSIWVVLLRLAIASAVRLMVWESRLRHGVRERVASMRREGPRLARHVRRATWVAWYESSQRVSRWGAKAGKRARKWRRRVDEGLRRRVPRARALAGRVARGTRAR